MPKGAGVRNFLLVTTSLITLATPAYAAPVLGLITTIGTWFTSTFGATLGGILLNLGGSLILSTVSALLRGKQKQSDVIRELLQPTSLPVWRFVYGSGWAPGTPAPVRVKGKFIYACFLLNSRPSAGPFTVYLDKRAVEVTGDPYNFSGSGAAATNAPFTGHCNYWIGRGDQTSPPTVFTAEAPEFYKVTDGWRGRTVLWVKLNVGNNKDRVTRWPATPPEVNVGGNWSLLWNPRDPAQSPDNPATWTFSKNQALATLDALRQNPLRPYDLRNLWIDTFKWAADAADEAVSVKAGGTIPRYEANGILVFADSIELEDQVQPLADAGASRFMRVGGRLGLIPGVWQDPVDTVTDMLGDQPMTFTRYRPSTELVTAVTARYISPLRAYEEASTPVYTLAGAQAEDGGPEKLGSFDLKFITDHRQGQRVAKILGMRTRMQRSMSGALPPQSFKLVAGSVVTVDLPAPYHRRNGTYEVEEIHPGASPVGNEDGSVALACPAALRETSPTVYAWDAATEEQDVAVEDFDPEVGGVKVPGAITLVGDATTVIVSGDVFIPRIRFSFAPSPSASVISYEWQFRKGLDLWQTGGLIDAETLDGSGDVFGFLLPVEDGEAYTIRARAVSPVSASEWVISDPLTVVVDPIAPMALDSFSQTGAAPHLGNAVFAFKTKNDAHAWKVDIYRVPAGSPLDPTLLTPVLSQSVVASTTYGWTDGDDTRVNLVTNGDFATDTAWTKGTGWTISGGKGNKAAGASTSLDQVISLAAGSVYRTSYVVVFTAGTSFRIRLLNGAVNQNGTLRTASGTYRESLTALTGNTAVSMLTSSSFAGTVDDVVVYLETPTCVPPGDWDYHAVPRNKSGIVGPASGPITVTII